MVAAEEKDLYDITFIGAGPVALYGMYYAGLRLMKSKVIDMLGEVGALSGKVYLRHGRLSQNIGQRFGESDARASLRISADVLYGRRSHASKALRKRRYQDYFQQR